MGPGRGVGVAIKGQRKGTLVVVAVFCILVVSVSTSGCDFVPQFYKLLLLGESGLKVQEISLHSLLPLHGNL